MRGRALIIGGGIGGLATAVGLKRAGWEVKVMEQVDTLAEVGAGLAIWTNGLAALDALGLGDAVRAVGVPDADGWIRDHAGTPLLHLAPPALRQCVPELGFVVHRADLHTLLLESVGRQHVQLRRRVTRILDTPDSVGAVFSDGSHAEADVLIGADGLHSVVRAQLHGPAEPRYAGYTAWRAVVHVPGLELRPGESWGAGARFGHAPLSGDRVYFFATRNEAAGARGRSGERAELLRTFSQWHDPIPALLAAVREEDILRNDIYDRPVLPWWGRGRVTLLGDAAHPMTPNLGQGACQALEDAVALTRQLEEETTVAAALRAYEARRIPRANALVIQSRRAGAVGQWRHPAAVRVRSILTRRVLSRLQARQMERVLTG